MKFDLKILACLPPEQCEHSQKVSRLTRGRSPATEDSAHPFLVFAAQSLKSSTDRMKILSQLLLNHTSGTAVNGGDTSYQDNRTERTSNSQQPVDD